MKNRLFLQSIVILVLLSVWSIINLCYIFGLQKALGSSQTTDIKVFSKNKNILIGFVDDLKELEKKRLPNKLLQRFVYLTSNSPKEGGFVKIVNSNLSRIYNLQTMPIYTKLILKTNKKLVEEMANKYHLEYEEYLDKTIAILPHMLQISLNFDKISLTGEREKYENLYLKYRDDILLAPNYGEIKQKVVEDIVIRNYFYFLNGLIAFFVFLIVLFMRLGVEKENDKVWRIYKNLGYNTSYRKNKFLVSSLFLMLLPILFHLVRVYFAFDYNILIRYNMSYSLVVKNFIYILIYEIGVILFANMCGRVLLIRRFK